MSLRRKTTDYVRAAHYFSDGWALNFWQIADPARIRAELQALRQEGYDAVILVLPWRGVQEDAAGNRLDPFYRRQIVKVLAAVKKAGLRAFVRLSYGYHILPHHGSTAFTDFQRLCFDEERQERWLVYLSEVAKLCRRSGVVSGLFLSWEEFWLPLSSAQDRAQSAREYMARKLGFVHWLREQGVKEIDAIPPRGDPSYHLYHRFKNERIRQLFSTAQACVPDLSMEMRVDKDPQPTDQGIEWLDNDSYGDLAVTRFSYWAPFMGARNEGELLNAEQALVLLEHMLKSVARQGKQAKQLVDQFNFVDDTPDAGGALAQLEPTQIDAFLLGAAPLLKQYAAGHGLWAVRDYRLNVLFNARFLMGMQGWELCSGQCLNRCHRAGIYLAAGSEIRQILSAPISALQRDILFDEFEFELQLKKRDLNCRLSIKINAGDWLPLEVNASATVARATIPILHGDIWENGIEIRLRNEGRGQSIDSVQLYHQEYCVGIHNSNGEAGPLFESIQAFNRALT